MIDFWLKAVAEADALDWVVMAAYLLAAALAWRAGRGAQVGERRFWLLVAALLVFLGTNKLLDLQALLTAAARENARASGWFEYRRTIQLGFVVTLAGGAVLGGVIAVWLTRRMAATIKVALAGLALVGVAVLLRAGAFNHFGALAALDIGALRELPGIAVIAVSAWFYARPKSRGPNAAGSSSLSL